MTSILFYLALLLYYPIPLLTSNYPVKHYCYAEWYVETAHIGTCLNSSININITRCYGRCYSEDSLIYDWRHSPRYYRHEQRAHCCLPHNTIFYETKILCENKQLKTIKYPIVIDCQCKSCGENCFP